MKCLKSWMIFNSFHLHCPAWPCHEHSQRAQRSETATDGAPPRALSEAWPSAPTLPCSESCGSWRRPDFLLTVPLILKGFSGGALGACLHIITYIIIYIYNIYIYHMSTNLKRPNCWVSLVSLTFCVSTPTLETQISNRFSSPQAPLELQWPIIWPTKELQCSCGPEKRRWNCWRRCAFPSRQGPSGDPKKPSLAGGSKHQ